MGSSSVVELPLLPLRDVVVYPHMVLPLFVGRDKSIQALEDAMATDKQVLLVANLEPVKLMGIESCGMVLAAGDTGPSSPR